MTFSEILTYFIAGYPVRRKCYTNNIICFKQVPAHIDNIAPMQSIPEKVKDLLLKHEVTIDYESQFIYYDFDTGVATYQCFDGDDINAKDWEVVDANYDPYVE